MKREYSNPTLEVIVLSVEDVMTGSITVSMPGDNDGNYGDIA